MRNWGARAWLNGKKVNGSISINYPKECIKFLLDLQWMDRDYNDDGNNNNNISNHTNNNKPQRRLWWANFPIQSDQPHTFFNPKPISLSLLIGDCIILDMHGSLVQYLIHSWYCGEEGSFSPPLSRINIINTNGWWCCPLLFFFCWFELINTIFDLFNCIIYPNCSFIVYSDCLPLKVELEYFIVE